MNRAETTPFRPRLLGMLTAHRCSAAGFSVAVLEPGGILGPKSQSAALSLSEQLLLSACRSSGPSWAAFGPCTQTRPPRPTMVRLAGSTYGSQESWGVGSRWIGILELSATLALSKALKA